jgi:hypothetical protein
MLLWDVRPSKLRGQNCAPCDEAYLQSYGQRQDWRRTVLIFEVGRMLVVRRNMVSNRNPPICPLALGS